MKEREHVRRSPSSETSGTAIEWMAAAFITLIALFGLAILGTPKQLAFLCAGLFVLVLSLVRSLRLMAPVLRFSAPFVIPIMLIHAVLNPQYQITFEFLNLIPFRSDGFTFGLGVSLRVVAIFVLGAMWFAVDRDKIISDLICLGTPLPVLIVTAQAVAVAGLIQRRARAIYDAQQARGIKVGPGFFARAAALPKVMIPLFVTVINDADMRSSVMAARGFGSGPVSVWIPFAINRTVWISGAATIAIVIIAAMLTS